MSTYPDDIFTEPDGEPDTLANLGPLGPMAGVWEGRGVDVHPVAEGSEEEPYDERIELQPTDRQTNGPQLFYGLRYHAHIVRPGEIETFHDQVGYWLWEPATETVTLLGAIPRAQVLMAAGHAAPDATEFELTATRGDPAYGILSNPFLERAFRTPEFSIRVTVHPDGTWSYDEDTVLEVEGREGQFHHTDRNTLTRVAPSVPNPLARS